MSPALRDDLPAYLKLLAVVLIWGGTFVAGRQLAGSVAPLLAASVRFLLASLVLGGLLALLPPLRRLPSRRQFGQLAVLGFFGVFVYNLCLFQGLQSVSASRASLIVALNPAAIALASAVLFKERLSLGRQLGIAVCLLGAGTVILGRDPQALGAAQGVGQGDLLMLGCVLSWGVYSLFGRALIASHGALATVAWSVLLGSVMLCALAISQGALNLPALAALKRSDWFSLGYLGIVGSALAYYWYYQAIARIGPTRSGVFIALNPLSAVLFAALLLGEQLGPVMALGGALVLLGIVLCNWPGRLRPKA